VLNPSDLTKLVVQSPAVSPRRSAGWRMQGHIKRRPDPGDRRALLVVLTDKGRRRRRTGGRRAGLVLRTTSWPTFRAPERAELTVLLRKVLDRLEVHTKYDEKCLAASPQLTATSGTHVAVGSTSADRCWSEREGSRH